MPRAITLPSGNQLQPLLQRLPSTVSIGIDLGDRYSQCCILDASGDVIAGGRVRTTPQEFADHFKSLAPALIAIEVGPTRVGSAKSCWSGATKSLLPILGIFR